MSSVFMISTNTNVEPYPVYPIGMSVIAGALTQAGHKVFQYDMLAHGESLSVLREKIALFAPDYVGISIRNVDNVDSFTSHMNGYLEKVREIVTVAREFGVPILAGGAGFSLLPEEILNFIHADYGVVGEGERKMVRLISCLEQGQEPERVFGPEKGIPGSEIPAPLWSRELLDYYMAESGVVSVQTKRGCEHRCSYCTYPYLEGRKMRLRNVKSVGDEIEKLCGCGATDFFFTDSVFNDKAGHYLQVAEEIVRRGLDIRWCGFFQPAKIEPDELDLLKLSGMNAVEVGTDATSDTTMKGLSKGFTYDEVMTFNDLLVSRKIPCAHFVIFGGPDETMETVREGINNMNALKNCAVFAFSGVRLHKGTPLFARAIKEGLVSNEQPLLEPFYYFSPHLDKDEMNRVITEGFHGRRDRLFPPDEGQQRINIMKKFGFRGIMWDRLIRFND